MSRIHYIRPDEDAPPQITASEAKDLNIDNEAMGWEDHLVIVDITIPYSGVTFRGPVSDLFECFMRIGMDAVEAALPLYETRRDPWVERSEALEDLQHALVTRDDVARRSAQGRIDRAEMSIGAAAPFNLDAELDNVRSGHA